jgi:hypothetical protein
MKRIILALFLLSGLVFSLFSQNGGQNRYALLIGNGEYRFNSALQNPANDAEDLAQVLSGLGFQVTLVKNAGLSDMEEAIFGFRKQLMENSKSAGFFFFAGHGVQSQGLNYLLPVDQDIQTEAQLRRAAIPASEVLEYMNEANNRFNMVILDACRNNPLTGSFRSASRGLAVIGQVPPESVVVYSTGAGQVAEDGAGRNSPFSAALIRHITSPGIEVETMLREVTRDVQASTSSGQTPYRYSSLTSDFYFADTSAAAAEPAAPIIKPARAAVPRDLPERRTITFTGRRIQWGTSLYTAGFWGGYPDFLDALESDANIPDQVHMEIDAYRSYHSSGVIMQIGGLAVLGAASLMSGNMGPDASESEMMLAYSGLIGGVILGTIGMIRSSAIPEQVIISYNNETAY